MSPYEFPRGVPDDRKLTHPGGDLTVTPDEQYPEDTWLRIQDAGIVAWAKLDPVDAQALARMLLDMTGGPR